MDKFNETINIVSGDYLLKDKELMVTGEEYLNNDLNVSETARVLYIFHQDGVRFSFFCW